jgi:uncharacterized protein YcfJ
MTRFVSTAALAIAIVASSIAMTSRPAHAGGGAGVAVGIVVGAVVGGIIVSEIVRRHHHRRHYSYARSNYRRY